jgi:hypothetical protein
MYRWEDDIKIDVKEIRWESMNWVNLAQTGTSSGLLWKANELSGSMKCQEFLGQLRSAHPVLFL